MSAKLPVGDPGRFYAHFKRAEEVGDGVLIGTHGNGATPEHAIAAYAQKISLRRIAVDAYSEGRREIDVPRLVQPDGGI
jgi:hypothetical protein